MEKYNQAQQKRISGAEVHSRDKKLFDKLKAKETKVNSLQEEIRRIKVKDNAQGGLTEGCKYAYNVA
jgi:hypothetical protein